MRDTLQFDKCARLLKALADPERLKLVQCLQDGPKNVGELAALLGQELVNVSHHLGVLRHAGLVTDQKQGKYVIYSLHRNIFRAKKEAGARDCLDLGCCRVELGRR